MSAALEPVQGPPALSGPLVSTFTPNTGSSTSGIRDRLRWPGRLDATILQDNNVIAILRCQIHVMDRHEGGHTHATNEIEDFELVSDIQVVGGLVEDQDTGPPEQGRARISARCFSPPGQRTKTTGQPAP